MMESLPAIDEPCRERTGRTADLPSLSIETSPVCGDYQTDDLGPLEPLMSDPTISEIQVYSADSIFIVRNRCVMAVQDRFDNAGHLLAVIKQLVAPEELSEESPIIKTTLHSTASVTAALTRVGFRPLISIRFS